MSGYSVSSTKDIIVFPIYKFANFLKHGFLPTAIPSHLLKSLLSQSCLSSLKRLLWKHDKNEDMVFG